MNFFTALITGLVIISPPSGSAYSASTTPTLTHKEAITALTSHRLTTHGDRVTNPTAEQTPPQTPQQSNKQQIRRSRRPRRPPRPPRPPRRLPPNQVQPGGGLDAYAQACDPDNVPVTALVPIENPVYTAQSHPSFLFHLPDEPEQIDYVEFILFTADEKEQLYSTTFEPEAAGIVSIELPADQTSGLEVDGVYHWYLNVHCQNLESIPSVNGWVQRSTPVATTEVSDMPELWYDAIAQTAQDLRAQTSDHAASSALAQQWETWLTAAGLADLIDRPLVGPVIN